jgi:competence protein ComEC
LPASIRPALSPLTPALAAAFFVAAGTALLIYRGLMPAQGWLLPGVLAAVVLLFATLRWLRRFALRVAALTLAAALAAAGTATQFYADVAADAEALAGSQGTRGVLRVNSDATISVYGAYSTAELLCGDGRRAQVRLNWAQDETPAALGSTLEATFDFSALREADEMLFCQGICGSVRLTQHGEPRFANDIPGAIAAFRAQRTQYLAAMGGVGAALNSAMLLGDRQRLSEDPAYQDFKVTGLTHLIAVSGSHLAVIAALLSWLLRRLPIARVVSFAALVATLSAYVILTACQPSAIRAAIMVFCGSLSLLGGRRAHSPSALVLAATGMILVSPANAFSLGFWLSVFSVLGLVLFTPLVSDWLLALFGGLRSLPRLLRRPTNTLLELVALTLTAQLAVQPLSTPFFAMISCISPLANLAAAPLMTLMVGAGIVLFCLPLPLLELLQPLVALLNGLGDLLVAITAVLARLPFASVPATVELVPALLGALAAASLLYLLWPRATAARARGLAAVALVALLALQVVAPRMTPPSLVMMDIGQGDALLIRDGPRSVLIDTGPSDSALLHALARAGVTRLDCVVITHLDSDHCGALDALLGTVIVGEVVFARGLLGAGLNDEVFGTAGELVGTEGLRELGAGDRLSLSGRLWAETLWPEALAQEGGNEESVCMLLHYDAQKDGIDEASVLLTGDAEAPELQQMIANGSLAQRQIDIIKVGHHGSNDSLRPEQLQELAPQLALISAGANNRYGHPTAGTLTALADADVPVLRTDTNGDVTVDFNASGFSVRCATISE